MCELKNAISIKKQFSQDLRNENIPAKPAFTSRGNGSANADALACTNAMSTSCEPG